MGFAEIKGQDTAVQILKKSILGNHISHAYIFQGIEGVGKKTTALALAQALNCLNFDTSLGGACGECLGCIKVENGNHPDLHIIIPEKYVIKIDQIRSLKSKVFYKCYEGRKKVIIFDDAHNLTIEASNSLLKVLEEPPQDTVFILVSSEPGKLPDTIISRCQQIQFQPLSVYTIKEHLIKENPEKISQISLAASLAGGSLAKAEELLAEGEVLENRQETINFVKKLFELSFSDIIIWCEKWDREKKKVKTILEIIQLWYRDLLVFRTTGREEILINQDHVADIKNSQHTLININYALLLINESIKNLESNVSPRLVLEVFFMKLKIK
ncbi:MAG: hypothetical protein VR72_21540 [Clostridiaceae bacterium BRH_c20a]|nr:MAG: hypothetical protein VR72_21540 [Clostridiaceae bacterium BRH_c20a]